MFGLGFTEIVVILVVALLVFGPTKLPELARSLGKGLAEFRRASSDIRSAVMDATNDTPQRPPLQGPADQVAAAVTPAEQAQATRAAESEATTDAPEHAEPVPSGADDASGPGPGARD